MPPPTQAGPSLSPAGRAFRIPAVRTTILQHLASDSMVDFLVLNKATFPHVAGLLYRDVAYPVALSLLRRSSGRYDHYISSVRTILVLSQGWTPVIEGLYRRSDLITRGASLYHKEYERLIPPLLRRFPNLRWVTVHDWDVYVPGPWYLKVSVRKREGDDTPIVYIVPPIRKRDRSLPPHFAYNSKVKREVPILPEHFDAVCCRPGAGGIDDAMPISYAAVALQTLRHCSPVRQLLEDLPPTDKSGLQFVLTVLLTMPHISPKAPQYLHQLADSVYGEQRGLYADATDFICRLLTAAYAGTGRGGWWECQSEVMTVCRTCDCQTVEKVGLGRQLVLYANSADHVKVDSVPCSAEELVRNTIAHHCRLACRSRAGCNLHRIFQVFLLPVNPPPLLIVQLQLTSVYTYRPIDFFEQMTFPIGVDGTATYNIVSWFIWTGDAATVGRWSAVIKVGDEFIHYNALVVEKVPVEMLIYLLYHGFVKGMVLVRS